MEINKNDLLNKFTTKEEKMLVSKVLDQYNYCKKARGKTFTDFVDPIKAEILIKILSNDKDINIESFGGYGSSERTILGFSPKDNLLKIEDFPISSLEIKYNSRFHKELTHREFLGSILGLGIKRSKLGDILIFEGKSIVFILDDIVEYICANLTEVTNSKVTCKIVTNEIEVETKKEENIKTTVASLRLDAVISNLFHVSRGKANDFVESEKVFINWVNITNTSKQVNVNDIITVRGIGRIKINEILGKSKKDRIIISVTKY